MPGAAAVPLGSIREISVPVAPSRKDLVTTVDHEIVE